MRGENEPDDESSTHDDPSFDQWYPELYKRLVRFLIYRTGLSPEAAEEVAQDTFEIWVRNEGRGRWWVDRIANRDAWFFTVARNKAIRVSRRERREAGLPLPRGADVEASGDDGPPSTTVVSHRPAPDIEEIPDARPPPEDEAIAREAAANIRGMIQAARERCALQRPGSDNAVWCNIKGLRDDPKATDMYRDAIWRVAAGLLRVISPDWEPAPKALRDYINDALRKEYPDYFDGVQLSEDNRKQRLKRSRDEVHKLWRRWGLTLDGLRADGLLDERDLACNSKPRTGGLDEDRRGEDK